MGSFIHLLITSSIMFIGTYSISRIPLMFRFNMLILSLINVFGIGLLIGTSFIVIIPEGINTYFTINNEHEHDDSSEDNLSCISIITGSHLYNNNGMNNIGIGSSLIIGFILMLIIDKLSQGKAHIHHNHNNNTLQNVNSNVIDNNTITNITNNIAPTSNIGILNNSHNDTNENIISDNNVNNNNVSIDIIGNNSHLASLNLYGIIIHSAIDGLALGSISASNDNNSNNGTPDNTSANLQLIVFLAIILHKFPAAFGLSSFLLLYENNRIISRRFLNYKLLQFSAAAPAAAIITHILFSQYNYYNVNNNNYFNFNRNILLGLCLLFSGGTFLFTIAVHILPEINKSNNIIDYKSNIALICGLLAPLLLTSHHHQH